MVRKRRRRSKGARLIANIGPIRLEYFWWEYGMGPIKGALPVLEFKRIKRPEFEFKLIRRRR